MDRRLFHRCGASVDLESSVMFENTDCAWRSRVPVREFCIYDEISIFCIHVYINVNYVCSIDHYNFGDSHASDIIICLNGSLRGITNHV